MQPNGNDDGLLERLVTHRIEVDGRLIVIENVPARVNEETGERFFAPDVVERLQQLVREDRPTTRVIETPVIDFAG